MAQYKDKGFPAFPGAYLVNYFTTNSTTNGGSFPIYKSTPNLGIQFDGSSYFNTTVGASNKNDFFLVMPGYKLIIYTDANYSSSTETFDNTSNSTIYHVTVTSTTFKNNVESVKLYYNNVEIL
jgi:hypothetical protein